MPDQLRAAFVEAWEGFPQVHEHKVSLRLRQLSKVSMRAQPVVNTRFFSRASRDYVIEMKRDQLEAISFRLVDCPHEVLVGWLAHELGHVVDYLERSWANLLAFGVNYLWSPTFRIGAERQADIYAIENGFAKQIQATKRFILEESKISNKYLDRINKYYMSPDEVEQIVLHRQKEEAHRDRVV